MNWTGVKVDEDFKRYYPYGNLASKVLGFTGGDNQGNHWTGSKSMKII